LWSNSARGSLLTADGKKQKQFVLFVVSLCFKFKIYNLKFSIYK